MKKENTLSYREIYDQPRAMESLMEDKAVYLETIDRVFSENHFDEVIFTGCGTSFYIAQIAAAVFANYNKIKAKSGALLRASVQYGQLSVRRYAGVPDHPEKLYHGGAHGHRSCAQRSPCKNAGVDLL